MSTSYAYTRTDDRATSLPLLMGAQLDTEWLKNTREEVTSVFFTGNLRAAFADIESIAKEKKYNLPIEAFRLLLRSEFTGIISLASQFGDNKPVIVELGAIEDIASQEYCQKICELLKRWIQNTLDPWVSRNEFDLGQPIQRLIAAVQDTNNYELSTEKRPLFDSVKKEYDFSLIQQIIAIKLDGEQLFSELSTCSVISSPYPKNNSIEFSTSIEKLVTQKGRQRDERFVMVAEFSLVQPPYGEGAVYLNIKAKRRTFATKIPDGADWAINRATAYVYGPLELVAPVSIERISGNWEFGDDYQSFYAQSEGKLPATLEEAMNIKTLPESNGWWVGLPETTRLYNTVSNRTVFEIDEYDLLKNVTDILSPILNREGIQFRHIKLRGYGTKTEQRALNVSSLHGGAVLDWLDDKETDEVVENSNYLQKLEETRNQNIHAIHSIFGDAPPVVFVTGGVDREQSIVQQAIELLFGQSVKVETQPLPENTHGLRAKLPGADLRPAERFDLRVKEWEKSLTKAVRKKYPTEAIVAIIIAPDRFNNTPEDVVNYYAGIHAWSSISANVHHLLPISDRLLNRDDIKGIQDFMHRTQSALLDVLLAHGGFIFNTESLKEKIFSDVPQCPNLVFGLQVVGSNARHRSGEQDVHFVLFSKLDLSDGSVSVKIIYNSGRTQESTSWMPLSKGLQWMGARRSLTRTKYSWIKQNFEDIAFEQLKEINQNHKGSVVFFDWSCLRGLCSGFNDTHLSFSKTPKLASRSLNIFSDITIVRIRRNRSATIALRSENTTTYQGLDEARGSSGYIRQDVYISTQKEMVELNPDFSESHKNAHFIVSMGYPSTVQVARGFSCYRSTSRMVRDAQNKNIYRREIREPSSKEAAIPASTDITVFNAQPGIAPEAYAILATSLRLGYPHFSDWTANPAPIFFANKVRDYVIRYPILDSDTSFNENASVAIDDDLTLPTPSLFTWTDRLTQTPQSEQGSDEEGGVIEQNTPEKNTESDTVLGQTDPLESDESYLSQAKALPIVDCLKDKEFSTRYWDIINQRVSLDIELPKFAQAISGHFVTFETPVSRMTVKRVYRTLGNLRVPKKICKPSAKEFLEIVDAWIKLPLGCVACNEATRPVGAFTYTRLKEIIENEVNLSFTQSGLETISPFRFPPKKFELLSTWAKENNHDELYAWLIFALAQSPDEEWSEVILEPLQKPIGPLSQEALRYYVEAHTAFLGHNKNAEKSNKKTVATENTSAHLQHAERELNLTSTNENPQISASEQVPSNIDELRVSVTDTLSKFIPGDSAAETKIGELERAISLLRDMHTQQLVSDRARIEAEEKARAEEERQKQEEERKLQAKKEAEKKARALVLKLEEAYKVVKTKCDSLNAIGLSEDIGKLQLKSLDLTNIENPEQTLENLENFAIGIEPKIDALANAKKQFDEFSSLPSPTKVRDITSHQYELLERSKSLTDSIADLDNFIQLWPFLLHVSNDHLADPASKKIAEVINENPPTEKTANAVRLLNTKANMLNTSSPQSSTKEQSEAELDDSTFEEVEGNEEVNTDEEFQHLVPMIQSHLFGLAEVQSEALVRVTTIDGEAHLKQHASLLYYMFQSVNYAHDQRAFRAAITKASRQFFDGNLNLPELHDDAGFPAVAFFSIYLAPVLMFNPRVNPSEHLDIGFAVRNHFGPFKQNNDFSAFVSSEFKSNFPVNSQLSREHFLASKIGDQKARELELLRFKKRAATWETDSDLQHNFKHVAFQKAHSLIYSNNHAIGRCIQAISTGDINRVTDCYEKAKRLFDKPEVTFNSVYNKQLTNKRPDGAKRQSAINNINITKAFIEEFIRLSTQSNAEDQSVDYSIKHYLETLSRHIDKCLQEIENCHPNTPLGYIYKELAVFGFTSFKHLFSESESTPTVSARLQRALLDVPLESNLYPILDPVDRKTGSLCRPDEVFSAVLNLVSYNDDGSPVNLNNESVFNSVLEESLHVHLNARRCLPAFEILSVLKSGGSSASIPNVAAQHHTFLSEFKTDLINARQRVTSAMTLDAIPIDSGREMLAQVEALLSEVDSENSIGRPSSLSRAYADFPQAIASLSHNVNSPLREELNKAKSDIISELADLLDDGRITDTEYTQWSETLNSSHIASIRAANDALSFFRKNGELPPRLKKEKHYSDRYVSILEDLKSAMPGNHFKVDNVIKLLESGDKSILPEWMHSFPEENQGATIEILRAWREMLSTAGTDKDITQIKEFFRLLGMPTDQIVFAPQIGRSKNASIILNNNSFRNIAYSPETELFVPPSLGSNANYLEATITVSCRNVDEIEAIIPDHRAEPTVIITSQHLSMRDRARLGWNRPVFIIDECSVIVSAIDYDNRLETLLQVGMLTYHDNPYDDYNAEPVPPEMFFGREAEVRSLHDTAGTVVIYGGRRLGKTSLLNMIKIEADRRKDTAAVIFSIRGKDFSGDYKRIMWDLICDELSSAGIITPFVNAESISDIQKHIRRELEKSGLMRLYLLIDEADSLMEIDLKQSSNKEGFVASMYQLTEDVQGCKIVPVYAGLHNMARLDAERSSNSVYARSKSIPIRAFSTHQDMQLATRLIVKPIEALGYTFDQESENLPFRIMSVCNFYPSFIQLYCKRLLQTLINNRQKSPPPFMVRAEDLDDVERDADFLNVMREKFAASLDLDKRYKAIALVLADQWHEERHEGYNLGLTVSEIRERCQTLFEQHFRHTGAGAYEALLDEMEKLNVIVKHAGHYTLRTHNIAMLFGEHDDVLTSMDSLMNQTATIERSRGDSRAILRSDNKTFIFPMPIAWLRNYLSSSTDEPLAVITGNDLMAVKFTIDNWQFEGHEVFIATGNLENRISRAIKSRRQEKNPTKNQLLLLPQNLWSLEKLNELAALHKKSSRYGIKLLLIARPERALELANALVNGELPTTGDKSAGWDFKPIPPWTADSIYFYCFHFLENEAVAENEELHEKMLEGTGGFSYPLEKLCSKAPSMITEALNIDKGFLPKNITEFYRQIGLPEAIGEQTETLSSILVEVDGKPRTHDSESGSLFSPEIISCMIDNSIDSALLYFLYFIGLIRESSDGKWKAAPNLMTLIFR